MSKSQDIRSFFSVVSKKSGTSSAAASSTTSPVVNKKLKKLVDSDEDVIDLTPEPLAKKKPIKRKTVIISSDSEDDFTTSKNKLSKSQPTTDKAKKLKPVNVVDIFTKTPIKQSKVEVRTTPKTPVEAKAKTKGKGKSKSKKGGKNTELGFHSDPEFEKTLLQLDEDDDIFENNIELLDQSVAEALRQEAKKMVEEKRETENINPASKEENGTNKEEQKSDKGTLKKDTRGKNSHSDESHKTPSTEQDKKQQNKVDKEENDSKTERKRSRTDSEGATKTPKKAKIEHSDSGVDPGQEAHEKKRYSAMLYQKYLHRSGPKNQGKKEMPTGKPDCLKNLCFLKTGVLDSLDSEEMDNLVKRHGGRTVHSVSKKVNYIVVGEDPGPSKVAKAESLGIPTISEDQLLDMILTKSGMDAKFVKASSNGTENPIVSADLGFGGSETIDDSFDLVDIPTDSPKAKKNSTTSKLELKTPESPKEKKEVAKAKSSEVSTPPKPQEVDPSNQCLTEKYKPQTIGSIIGQQAEGSNMLKLKRWLMNWYRNQDPDVRKKLVRPSPWAKSDDGAYFQCALLSGPPGVGKTTTATLVARELGFDVVEFNASDTRSKKLLHQEVKELLSTNTIAGFAVGKSEVTKKRVLLMDEVDGMAGNEDRGGMQELIQLIKTTNVPIVCMCNDRNHQKMRSLSNYCFDLRFAKPKAEQIRGAMMSVCFKEGLKIPPPVLTEIILGTGCDIRQTLNHIAMWAASGKNMTTEEAQKDAQNAKKDTVLGPWEVCRTVFTQSEHKDMTLVDRAKLFFYDYSIGPLFVQENYLKVQPSNSNPKKSLLKAAQAADCISIGNLIDSKIRRTNNWSLLESQAFFASVLPGFYMSGTFGGQINFPGWLGKNSKKRKFDRLFSELQVHTCASASASKLAIKLDYLIPLRDAVCLPLKNKGMDGITDAVEVMKNYSLLRDDLDSLLELSQWSRSCANPMSAVDSKVKAAFTRTYNKQVALLPFAPPSGVSKKRAAAQDEASDLLGAEEDPAVQSDNEEEDDITTNTMIKVKNKTAGKAKKSSEAGTSKKSSESKKGKGKKR